MASANATLAAALRADDERARSSIGRLRRKGSSSGRDSRAIVEPGTRRIRSSPPRARETKGSSSAVPCTTRGWAHRTENLETWMFCRRAAKKWPHSWTKMMEASTAIACAVEAGPSSWKPLPRRPAPPRARPVRNQSARGRHRRGRGRRPPRARGRGDARGCRATRGRSRAHHARRRRRRGAGTAERRGADARASGARAGPAEIVLRVPRSARASRATRACLAARTPPARHRAARTPRRRHRSRLRSCLRVGVPLRLHGTEVSVDVSVGPRSTRTICARAGNAFVVSGKSRAARKFYSD